jgi:hypothetical protein
MSGRSLLIRCFQEVFAPEGTVNTSFENLSTSICPGAVGLVGGAVKEKGNYRLLK